MAIPSLYLVSVEDVDSKEAFFYSVAANSHDEAERMRLHYHEELYEHSIPAAKTDVRLIDKVLNWNVVYKVEFSPEGRKLLCRN